MLPLKNIHFLCRTVVLFSCTSVPDPDPPGSEIICFQGSRSEMINFGSGSVSGSSLFCNQPKKYFSKNELNSEQIHQDFIHNTWKFSKVCDFKTFVSVHIKQNRQLFPTISNLQKDPKFSGSLIDNFGSRTLRCTIEIIFVVVVKGWTRRCLPTWNGTGPGTPRPMRSGLCPAPSRLVMRGKLIYKTSVSDQYYLQYGSWYSILGLCGFGPWFQIRIWIQVLMTQWEMHFFKEKTFNLLAINWGKDLDLALPGSSENHQALSKMVNALFNLKSEIFSFFDVILTVLDPESVFPIRIWNQGGSHFNTDPHESWSGSKTLSKTLSLTALPVSLLFPLHSHHSFCFPHNSSKCLSRYISVWSIWSVSPI